MQGTLVPPMPGFAGIYGRPLALGRTFYVRHYSGDDTARGDDPNDPLRTITRALALCEAERNDYIYVLDCYADDEETWPIPVNKAQVHIIGLGPPTPMRWPALVAAATAVFDISVAHVEIAGFAFGAEAASACIEFTASGEGGWIHHCNFGQAAARDGIYAAGANNGSWLRVENCHFDHGLTRDGVHIEQGSFYDVWDCIFAGYGNIGINVPGGAVIYNGTFLRNYFYRPVDSPPDGWAISLNGSHGGLIAGNYAAEAGDNSPDTNPYLDTSTDSLTTLTNGWAGNYVGNVVTAPKTG